MAEKMGNVMQTAKSLILRLTLVVFLLCSAVILIDGIANFQIQGEWYASMNIISRSICMCLAVLFFIILFYLLWKKLDQESESYHRVFTILTFAVLIIGQLAIIFLARPCLRHDALKVFDEALSMIETGGVTPSHFDDYFLRYTNNYGMLIFTYLLLRVMKLVGILALDSTGGMLLVQIVNIIAIDISLIIGLFFLRRLYGVSFEKANLIFILLCPLFYVWGAFYYTNIIAMPFFMLMIYLASLSLREGKWPVARCLLIGFLAGIGFYLRATQAIMVIAILIYVVFHKNNLKKSGKVVLALFLCVLGLVAAVGGYKVVEKKYVMFDYSDSAFPAIHWVMMGLTGDGDFNQRDEMYTRSFATKQEKKEADLELLKQRVEELKASGVIKQFISKMKLTFSDGTGNYPAELAMSDNYGKVYQFIYGRNRSLLFYYCQACYLALLLLAFIGGIRMFLTADISELYIMMISLTGGFLFHMLWEAGSIYSIGFMPLLLVSAAFGMEYIGKILDQKLYRQKNSKKTLKRGVYPIIALTILINALISIMCLRTVIGNDMTMNQFMFVFDEYQVCDENITLTQSFMANKSFNTIDVMVHNPLGEANDSKYEISLFDSEKKLLETSIIEAKNCMDLTYQTFEFTPVVNKKKNEYFLTIKKLAGQYNLEFPYYGTGNYDLYQNGELTGAALSKADLTMRVYKK